MDVNKIIAQGTEAKFKVEIKDFNMVNGDFFLEIINGYRRTLIEIEKGQMFSDVDGNFYFLLDTECLAGKVTAKCTWYVPDTDCNDGLRTRVNEQFLCFVAPNPCPLFACKCDCIDGDVTYTRIDASDLSESYSILCDKDGKAILTANDEYIYVQQN